MTFKSVYDKLIPINNFERKAVKSMKQYIIYLTRELFPGNEIVNNRSFGIFNTREESVFLAVVCPIQTAISGLTRGRSAHFQREDCFECLSPQISAA